jgi:hypothetical protein
MPDHSINRISCEDSALQRAVASTLPAGRMMLTGTAVLLHAFLECGT